MMNQEEVYWTNRYNQGQTGWDIGNISTPIKEYIDQLESKNIKILIPGAGNSHEAQYIWENGFHNVHVLDISASPLANLKKRVPDFPDNQLIKGDFFEHEGQYDLIIEQTFFCSFLPSETNRSQYASKMHSLLKPGGKLVGLWFNFPLDKKGNRPFGGSKEEYLNYFDPLFDHIHMEDCYNSIKPRKGNEYFGILVKG